MLLLVFAGWVNRHQLDLIDYLQEENRILKERTRAVASVACSPARRSTAAMLTPTESQNPRK
jgi:hypothetical protein